jgi:hypothetical protein
MTHQTAEYLTINQSKKVIYHQNPILTIYFLSAFGNFAILFNFAEGNLGSFLIFTRLESVFSSSFVASPTY